MDILELNLIEKGGPILWVLLFIAFLGLVLSVERFMYLHKDQIRAGEFLTGIKNLLRKRRLIEALTVCEETPGPVANIVKAALLNYNQSKSYMLEQLQTAALVQIPNLERRISSLSMIAKVAPLIGLLGTLVAIYQGYMNVFAQGAYADMTQLSVFISQALVTTIVGLMISIVAYMVHHFLMGRVKSLVHDMEWVGHDIMQFLLKDLPEEEEVVSE